MVLFAAPTKPFIYAPPSSTRVNRRDTLAEYNGEINALYKTIAHAAHMALNPPRVWRPNNSLVYVRGIIVAVLGSKLEDDADLFSHGTNRCGPVHLSNVSLDVCPQSTGNAHPYNTLPRSPVYRGDGHPKALG